MDPQATWNKIIELLAGGDVDDNRQELVDHLGYLAEWFAKGGFFPNAFIKEAEEVHPAEVDLAGLKPAMTIQREANDPIAQYCVMLTVLDRKFPLAAVYRAMQAGPAGVAQARRSVLAGLPKTIVRLVAVFPEEHASMLMQLHELYGAQIARQIGIDPDAIAAVRPPKAYIPPTQE